jgi:hypothetical protein
MFYLHVVGNDPSSGTPYATRELALSALMPGHGVTFVATDTQKLQWYRRESDRFVSGVYTDVPWGTLAQPHHYAHLSTGNPGLIAYTPDDAFGIDDRQLRVKPGKYLTQFLSHVYTPEQIVELSDAVKASSAAVHYATTPQECVNVYQAYHGPDSCMAGAGKWTDATHPAQVYGGGDTAVAYLGHIGGERANHTITARAVIRTDIKRFYRTYGSAAGVLETLLLAAGYERTDRSLEGARLRAVVHPELLDRWIMPYIDGRSYGTLSDDAEYIVVGSGPIGVQNVSGITYTYR